MSETPNEDTTETPEMLDAAEPEHDTVKKSEDGDSGGNLKGMLPAAEAEHDSSQFGGLQSRAMTFSAIEPDDE